MGHHSQACGEKAPGKSLLPAVSVEDQVEVEGREHEEDRRHAGPRVDGVGHDRGMEDEHQDEERQGGGRSEGAARQAGQEQKARDRRHRAPGQMDELVVREAGADDRHPGGRHQVEERWPVGDRELEGLTRWDSAEKEQRASIVLVPVARPAAAVEGRLGPGEEQHPRRDHHRSRRPAHLVSVRKDRGPGPAAPGQRRDQQKGPGGDGQGHAAAGTDAEEESEHPRGIDAARARHEAQAQTLQRVEGTQPAGGGEPRRKPAGVPEKPQRQERDEEDHGAVERRRYAPSAPASMAWSTPCGSIRPSRAWPTRPRTGPGSRGSRCRRPSR